jgi:sulfur carrier protein
VGDSVVPRAEWDSRPLREGDEVEILTAVQGG